MVEILLSEFGLRKREVLFDYTLAQLNMLVDARVERNERSQERREERRGREEKPKAPRGSMRDLKRMFGGSG